MGVRDVREHDLPFTSGVAPRTVAPGRQYVQLEPSRVLQSAPLSGIQGDPTTANIED